MAVIINEFEVVTEAAPPPAEGASAAPPAPPAMAARDVVAMVEHEHERALRVWAH